MRVELTVSLDIPGAEDFSDAELRQVIFDHYTNYVTTQHKWEAFKWSASVDRYVSAGDDRMAEGSQEIIRVHNTWAEIAKSAAIVSVTRGQ